MAEINPAALRDSFEDVVIRAQRLREWMDVEEKLRPLVNSFGKLNAEVKIDPNAWSTQKQGRLQDVWSNFQANDFTELQIVTDSLQFIKSPLPGNASAGSQVDTWITDLVNKGKQINTSLVGGIPLDLVQYCTEYQLLLSRFVANHRRVMIEELRMLCELTSQLRRQLEL